MKIHLFGWILLLGIILAFPAHDMSAEEFISPEEAMRQADLLKAQRQQDLMSPEEAVRQADLLQQQRYMSPQEAVQQANRLMQQPGSQQQPQQQMVYGTTGAEPHRPYPAWSAAPQMYQVPYPYQVTQVYQVYVQPLPQYPVYNANYPYSNYPYYNPYPYTVQPRQSQWEYQVSVQQLPRGYLPQSMRDAQQPEQSEYVPEALAADVDQQEIAVQQEVPAAQQPPQQIAAVVVLPEQQQEQTTQVKVKAGDREADVTLPQTASKDHLDTVKAITKTVIDAHEREQQQHAHYRRVLTLTAMLIGGTMLLGVLGYFAWGYALAQLKLFMLEILNENQGGDRYEKSVEHE